MPHPESTLVEALARAAMGEAEHGVRFVDVNERATFFSYAEVLRRAQTMAGALRATGVQPGDTVALVLPTAPAFLDAFFGAMLVGAVPAPLYPPLRLGKLDEYHARTAAMLRTCRARLVVTDGRIRRLLGAPIERARPGLGCRSVQELTPAAGEPAHRRLVPDERMQRCLVPDQQVHPEPDAPAFVQFSSGTTAAPRPVLLTHRQVMANVTAILAAIEKAHPQTHSCVSWLPLYHDMGLVGCLLAAVMHPGDLTLIPPEVFVARPALWLRTVSTYRASISPAPNFAYALCADRIQDDELQGVDLSSWRVALNGAEPVSPRVLERFAQRFAPLGLRREALTPVYGLAEATLAVTFSDLTRPFVSRRFDRKALAEQDLAQGTADGVELISLGKPLQGFKLRVVASASATATDGTPLPPGCVGRLWVHGPSLMQGYLHQPRATAEVLRDGWLDTGDLGFVHEGELYLYGRAKDLIVLRGRNIAPQDVEQALDGIDGTRPGCCSALGLVTEQGDGEKLVVLVERKRLSTASANSIVDAVRCRVLARLGVSPADVRVLEPGTLPRTSSGKIRRAAAGKRYLDGTLRPPDRVTWRRLAWAMLRSSLGFWRARRAS